MLYATNGARLYIADASANQAGASVWVEVGETEALGILGGAWEMKESAFFGCSDDIEIAFEKAAFRRGAMQIVFGDDPTDPGQAMLWKACRSLDSFPFRLTFPDAASVREWTALVVGMSEVFDTANSIIKTQVTLQPTSEIIGSETGYVSS